MNENILLVEPKTRTSYPPLGLMKIATYHHICGDNVSFVFGMDKNKRDEFWDKIYITSVFTYNFHTLVKTIQYYKGNPANSPNVMVGGIAASLLAKKLERETGVAPHRGLLNHYDPYLEKYGELNHEFKYLKECCPSIDNLPPSYDIFGDNQSQYSRILDKAYFFYTTKGCPNYCKFCAVKKLEPKYIDYIPIYPRVKFISDRWGEKQNMLLLDNNIAASTSFDKIMDEIKDCGFSYGEKLTKINIQGKVVYQKRSVDFNQGVDLRLMDKQKMLKMAEIAIAPLRLAFDDIDLAEEYEEKAKLAIHSEILNLSNYMLFNYKDKPIDLYRRFMVNIKLRREYPESKIFSFPMKYSPIYRINRTYVGTHWTIRQLRGLQLILNATHGIVSHNEKFFLRAFGDNEEQFERLLLYPYHYIINRDYYEYKTKDIAQWEKDYLTLGDNEKKEFKQLIKNGPLKQLPSGTSAAMRKILSHYEGEHTTIVAKDG